MKDRVVLIAGAASDIGEAVSTRLARAGATIVLVDCDGEALAGVYDKIVGECGKIEKIAMSVTTDSDVTAAVNRIVEEFGAVHALVNCVDTPDNRSISQMDINSWRELIENNLTAMFLFTKAVIPSMKQNKFGRIVHIGDIDYLGIKRCSSYATVKASIFGLTRSLALELAGEGITVNAVIKGDMISSNSVLSEEQRIAAEKQIPVNRLGTADDIAYAVSHFVSDRSNYITGQTLFVCGGKSLYSSMSV